MADDAEAFGTLVARVRETEFRRLGGELYLDHAGATLHSEAQLARVFDHLNSTLTGNPHSQSSSSMRASDTVAQARATVLRHFNTTAQTHDIVFTANASAALKLVGECFPWSSGSEFAYTLQNHNSVLGVREYATECGAEFVALDSTELRQQLGPAESGVGSPPPQPEGEPEPEPEPSAKVHSLFAFPGECNFSGQKLDLRLVEHFQRQRARARGKGSGDVSWCVLLDAAKLAATSPLDLTACTADFTCVSFYKMFGYPTGLGALIVRRSRSALLQRAYFAGEC
jgi:molybdenum cofactor sulfurtransferase